MLLLTHQENETFLVESRRTRWRLLFWFLGDFYSINEGVSTTVEKISHSVTALHKRIELYEQFELLIM